MDTVPRSSFIPKQASRSSQAKTQATRTVSILGIVSSVLFFGSLIAGAGLFGYTFLQKQQLETAQTDLAGEYSKFNDTEIKAVRAADEQLRAAHYLLTHHTSPSKIFDALEANTKQSVQYQSFTYEQDKTGDVTLNISGVTTEFAKVSLQWTRYLQDVVLADVAVTRVGLGSDEGEGGGLPGQQVNFELSANIDAANIAYQSAANLTPVVEDTEATEASEADVLSDPEIESEEDASASTDPVALPEAGVSNDTETN